MRPEAFGIALAVFTITTAVGAPLPSTGKFIFSDACESGGGDFEGHRMTLTRSSRGLAVFAEFNDQGPDGQDTARDVKFDAVSGKLSFSFHGSSYGKFVFHGSVDADKLEGLLQILDDSEVPPREVGHAVLRLPAVKTVPKYLPGC